MLIGLYYVIMQLAGYTIMGVDKGRAKRGEWRVPEKRLWQLAFFGAGLGLWLGMEKFRHKSKHLNFRLGFPLFTCLHAAFILFIYYEITFK
ncbi:DUF1294 domain-containing protein [Pullulanibacillus sp. KACC 23026]|uniref:DUF1294 domain-containing protein n=1 Tax=Pullulanibacillus sp. KACC 23026 TaxID=3028315 RepID=UPI0023AEAE1E|nr:DUF1294 domain-containing protein [Pullulanibacillus sp. KACC 23026]WEG13921.1 DUF1294 domain-containing protein [Pullulanibacillus sp. KACC 23026]